MNWLAIVVIALIAVMAIRGYRKGGLGIIFSMASGILFLMLVIWAGPSIDAYLTEHTGLRSALESRCEELAKNYVEHQLGNEVGDSDRNIEMPDDLSEKILEIGLRKAEEITTESGVYTQMASGMTDMIISAVSMIGAYFLGRFLLAFLSKALGIARYIPVLGGVDRLMGLVLGLVGGIVIVWIAFGFAALMPSGNIGSAMLECIYENEMLLYLYNNNIVLGIFVAFI